MTEIDPRDCENGWADSQADEIERLHAQVAQLRHFVGILTGWIPQIHPCDQIEIDEQMAESTDDWLTAHDAKIRDDTLEEVVCTFGIILADDIHYRRFFSAMKVDK